MPTHHRPLTARPGLHHLLIALFAATAATAAPEEESYPKVAIHPESVSPVLDGNGNILAAPGKDGQIELWVMANPAPYRLKVVGKDEVPPEFDQPNYPHLEGFHPPLFGEPSPLPVELSGYASFLPRDDGGFDIIEGNSLTYHRWAGTADAPKWEQYQIPFVKDENAKDLRFDKHGEKFVGDLNGDGVPDLAFMHYRDSLNPNPWMHRPGSVRPWQTERDPRIGTSEDYDITGPFRVNDITGRPTAKPQTLELVWAKGSRDAKGNLSFGKLQPVYFGNSDYPVFWEQFQNRAFVNILDTKKGKFIVLIEPMGDSVALPVIKQTPDAVHVGKPVPLLKDGKRLSGLIKSAGYTGFVDLDGDGVKELLVRGGAFGGIVVLKGDGPGDYVEAAVLRRTGPGAPVASIELTALDAGDFDGDGFEDLALGSAAGSLFLYTGTADPLVFKGPFYGRTPEGFIYSNRALEHDNLQGPAEVAWGYMNPHVADYDGDGKMDLLANCNTSHPVLYRGKEGKFQFGSPELLTFGGEPLKVQWRTKLAVLPKEWNFDGSGKACIAFIGLDRGLSVAIPKQPGGTEIERIVPVKDSKGDPLVLCGFGGQSGRTKINLQDWDRDGVWDLVFSTAGGLLMFFDPAMNYDFQEFRKRFGVRQQAQPYVWKNVGTNDKPVLDAAGPRRIGPNRPGPQIDPDIFRAGYHCFSVHRANLDGDDKNDILAADEHGHVLYFKDEDIKLGPNTRSPDNLKQPQ